MGTHCFIAIEDQDGSIRYIFCQFDGYLRNMIPIMKKDYLKRESVNRLIEKGGIVSLDYINKPCKPHISLTEKAADRWEFETEWRRDYTIPYLYMFTNEDTWEVACNGHMSLDNIMD